ncbi:ATP-binding protein [Ornithinimicrobium sp. CNJ-824]|uniref:ATP-binding protein n=1 Tax=Ornithinimicrobium sp. CNJ-824 TaxID=1904966 RepID=UPI00096A8664|nr:ATP-binding protein [Ornithinimicrobium sp. CNJ-824]
MSITSLEVQIQPESDIYSTYKRLSYRPWYALAEFVDNSTQNFYANRGRLEEVSGRAPMLTIDIFYDRDAGTLSVIDDALGMGETDFKRALQLAKPPKNTSGRSEFGMGLKTAACWLGPRWSVVSKQLGSDTEYSAHVDVERLQADKPRSLFVGMRNEMPLGDHYTRVDVEGLGDYDRVFVGRTLGKIKEELASMYRRDIESGDVVIRFNAEELSFYRPKIWVEQVGDHAVEWRKSVSIEVNGRPVRGWVALLDQGKAREAGFHLFRRGRLISGGPTQGWKPWEIFKAPNSFESQRLYGELEFDSWPVSHTKDQISWSGAEESLLIEALLETVQDYRQKARESRRGEKESLSKKGAESALEAEKGVLEDNDSLAAKLTLTETGVFPAEDPIEGEMVEGLLEDVGESLSLQFGGLAYPTLRLGLLDGATAGEPLVRLGFPQEDMVSMLLNLRHPFVDNFVGSDDSALRMVANLLYVDALVERVARRSPQLSPAQLRLVKDGFLRELRPLDE